MKMTDFQLRLAERRIKTIDQSLAKNQRKLDSIKADIDEEVALYARQNNDYNRGQIDAGDYHSLRNRHLARMDELKEQKEIVDFDISECHRSRLRCEEQLREHYEGSDSEPETESDSDSNNKPAPVGPSRSPGSGGPSGGPSRNEIVIEIRTCEQDLNVKNNQLRTVQENIDSRNETYEDAKIQQSYGTMNSAQFNKIETEHHDAMRSLVNIQSNLETDIFDCQKKIRRLNDALQHAPDASAPPPLPHSGAPVPHSTPPPPPPRSPGPPPDSPPPPLPPGYDSPPPPAPAPPEPDRGGPPRTPKDDDSDDDSMVPPSPS